MADAAPVEEVDERCCSICLSAYLDAVTLDCCTHVYCSGCITSWHATRGPAGQRCPDCRTPFTGARRGDGSVLDLRPHAERELNLLLARGARREGGVDNRVAGRGRHAAAVVAAPELREFTVRLTGVTHEGRQARVRALVPGARVALVREPDNPHDPRAVAVHDLAGNSLGFIPRAFTRVFHENPALQEATVFGAGIFTTERGQELAWATLLVQPPR